MLHRKLSFKILASLLIGLAVTVITIGSLVSFHQYKIWGKPLIHEFIGNKRDSDKSQKSFQSQKQSGNTSNHFYFQTPFLSAGNSGESHFTDFHTVIPFAGNQPDALQNFHCFAQGLRGPPLS
jgi:hypothetical protein